jgi:hypothetical protein
LLKKLDGAGVINGGERAAHNRHLKAAKKLVHTLRRSEQGLAFGVCCVVLGSVPIYGRLRKKKVVAIRTTTDNIMQSSVPRL